MVDLSSIGDVFSNLGSSSGSSSSGGGLSDLIRDVAPTVLSGASYLLNSNSLDKQNDTLNQGAQASAARLNQGYDEKQVNQEMGLDEIIKLLTSGLTDTTNQYRTSGFDYASGADRNVDKYSAYINPVLDQLTEGLSGAGDIYSSLIDKAANQGIGTLKEGSQDFERKMTPYTTTGNEALGYLQNLMGIDPNQLTPEQRIQFDDYTRDLMANLSASGLRGAGRAGVAAVGDSQGRLRAQLFKQNQDRADHAAELLNQQGYTATTNVANNLNALKKDISNIQLNTGTSKANNALDINKAIATSAFGVGQDVGNKRYASDSNVNQNTYNINKGIADQTNQLYKDLANITSDRYLGRGNTALAKANVDSSVGLNTAQNNAKTEGLSTALDTSALNKIGTMITQNNSQKAKEISI